MNHKVKRVCWNAAMYTKQIFMVTICNNVLVKLNSINKVAPSEFVKINWQSKFSTYDARFLTILNI